VLRSPHVHRNWLVILLSFRSYCDPCLIWESQAGTSCFPDGSVGLGGSGHSDHWLGRDHIGIVIAILIEVRDRYVDRPPREGSVGWLTRAGAGLAGPVSLLLRIFGVHNAGARYSAALCFIGGALIARYAWIAAGRVSARDPRALFQIQRREGDSIARS
jgi:hypothetical protein